MKILSFVFAVFLTVSVSALPGVSARANQEKVGSNGLMSTQKNSSPFTICIDDSDCLKLGQGDKYACFQVRIKSVFDYSTLLFEDINIAQKYIEYSDFVFYIL